MADHGTTARWAEEGNRLEERGNALDRSARYVKPDAPRLLVGDLLAARDAFFSAAFAYRQAAAFGLEDSAINTGLCESLVKVGATAAVMADRILLRYDPFSEGDPEISGSQSPPPPVNGVSRADDPVTPDPQVNPMPKVTDSDDMLIAAGNFDAVPPGIVAESMQEEAISAARAYKEAADAMPKLLAALNGAADTADAFLAAESDAAEKWRRAATLLAQAIRTITE
jgi:hypothetical protein